MKSKSCNADDRKFLILIVGLLTDAYPNDTYCSQLLDLIYKLDDELDWVNKKS